MKTHAELQTLLNKLRLTLETTTPGLHIIEAAITEDNFLLVTFVFKNKNDESVWLGPNEWPNLAFFDLCLKLIDRINDVLPTPKSTLSH